MAVARSPYKEPSASLELSKCAAGHPVVTILGPRQSGKTTLVKACFPNKTYSSLKDPDVRVATEADPRGFLSQCDGGGILDEIQVLPNLLSYIQGIVDNKQIAGQFILTGSHQPLLHQSVTQSLPGRTAMLALCPLSISELRQAEKELGVSATTIKEWISVLKASFIAFELQPYFANIRKRLVKSPKICFTDVGLAASLLGIHDSNQASKAPLPGNLYENLVIADILKDGLSIKGFGQRYISSEIPTATKSIS